MTDDGSEGPRCVNCEQLVYVDTRGKEHVWRHYINDSEFCHPNLAHFEAFEHTAVPDQ